MQEYKFSSYCRFNECQSASDLRAFSWLYPEKPPNIFLVGNKKQVRQHDETVLLKISGYANT